MRNLTKEESSLALARVWLDALEETGRDFFGKRPKLFTFRAYQHATESFLRLLAIDYGIKAEKAQTIKKALENYIDVGIKGGLFEDGSQFSLKEVTPFRVELEVLKCPYMSSCKDLVEEGIAISNLTCARIGCFCAAAKILAQIDCLYEVHSVALNNTCSGMIAKK